MKNKRYINVLFISFLIFAIASLFLVSCKEKINFEEEVKKIEVKIDLNKKIEELSEKDVVFENYNKNLKISIKKFSKNTNLNTVDISYLITYKKKNILKNITIKINKNKDEEKEQQDEEKEEIIEINEDSFNFSYPISKTSIEIKEEDIKITNNKENISDIKIEKRNYSSINIKFNVNDKKFEKELKTSTDKFINKKEKNNISINKYGILLDLLLEKNIFNSKKASKISENISLNKDIIFDNISFNIEKISYSDEKGEISLILKNLKILEKEIKVDEKIIINIEKYISPTINLKKSKNIEYQEELIEKKVTLDNFIQNIEYIKKLIKLEDISNKYNILDYEIEYSSLKKKEKNKFSYHLKIDDVLYKKDFDKEKEVEKKNNLIGNIISNNEEEYFSNQDILNYISKKYIEKSQEKIDNYPSYYKVLIEKETDFATALIKLSEEGDNLFKFYFKDYHIKYNLICNNCNDIEGKLGLGINIEASKESEEKVLSNNQKTMLFDNLLKFNTLNNEELEIVNNNTFRDKVKKIIDSHKDKLKDNEEVILTEIQFGTLFNQVKEINLVLSNDSAQSTLEKYNNNYSKHIKFYLGDHYKDFSEVLTSDKGVYFIKLGENSKYISLDAIVIKLKKAKLNLIDKNDEGKSRCKLVIECDIEYHVKDRSEILKKV